MIILMGVAGAGKSMQGRLFADEHGYAWLSTGELLRVLVTGKRRQEMLEGRLLSDDEVIKVIDKALDLINLSESCVLDGFPRTIHQADWLLEQSHQGRLTIRAVFNLKASEKVVEQRLLDRGRPDDTKVAIERRFREYNEVTMPILEHFKKEGLKVYDIDADKDPVSVHDQMVKIIDDN